MPFNFLQNNHGKYTPNGAKYTVLTSALSPFPLITKMIPGEITYTSVLNQSILILNSAKSAFDLLDKKSLIYSARPHLVMCGELVGWEDSLPCLSYGHQSLRNMRKLLHRVMGTKAAVEQFNGIMEEETRRFLKMVLDRPEDLQAHIRR
jgi:hypothetical protein